MKKQVNQRSSIFSGNPQGEQPFGFWSEGQR